MNYKILKSKVKNTIPNFIIDFLGNYLRPIYNYFKTNFTKRALLTYIVSSYKKGSSELRMVKLIRAILNYNICFGKKTGYCFIKKSDPKYRMGSGGSCTNKRPQLRITDQ